MADELITKQELIDAKPDVKNLGEAANGNETGIVTPRYGAPYSTAPAAIQKIQIDGANAIQAFQNSGSSAIQSFQTNSGSAITTFQNNATAAITKVESTGGLISAPTLSALQAIVPIYNYQLARISSTGDEYRWNEALTTQSKWEPTGRNFITDYKQYVDANALFNPVRLDGTVTANNINAKGIYLITSTAIATSVGVPVISEGTLICTGSSVSGDTGGTSGNVYQYFIPSTTGKMWTRVKKSNAWGVWLGDIVANLGTSDNLDNIITQGMYFNSNANYATTANNYPILNARGVLNVYISGSEVKQILFSYSGYAQRYGTISAGVATWQPWRGYSSSANGVIDFTSLDSANSGKTPRKNISAFSAISADTTSLDTLFTQGEFLLFSSLATTANGFPSGLTGQASLVSVNTNGFFYSQRVETRYGYAIRNSKGLTAASGWNEWSGFLSGIQMTDLTKTLVAGMSTKKIIPTFPEIAAGVTNLNNLMQVGNWVLYSSIATTANGFPAGLTGQFGILTQDTNTFFFSQKWETRYGTAIRYSKGLTADAGWNEWSGYIAGTQITDFSTLAPKAAVLGGMRSLSAFGSSTLDYMSDTIQAFCNTNNLYFIDHARAGDTTYGAGQAIGANIVTLRVPSGVILASGATTVSVTASMGSASSLVESVVLPNGVKGNLSGTSFTAKNLTANLNVSSTEDMRIDMPIFSRPRISGSIYVVNIGKNDVSNTVDNSQDIFNRTVAIIDSIPKNCDFIVGGHFVNTSHSEVHKTTVNNLNALLKAKYQLKYFDIANLLTLDSTWQTLGLTKTDADLAALADGALPPSLAMDNGHMSRAMDPIVMKLMEDTLKTLGYI